MTETSLAGGKYSELRMRERFQDQDKCNRLTTLFTKSTGTIPVDRKDAISRE